MWWRLVLHPPPDTVLPWLGCRVKTMSTVSGARGTKAHSDAHLPNMLHMAFMWPHPTSADAHSWAGPRDPNLAMTASSEPKMSTAEALAQAGVKTTKKELGQWHSPHI